MRIVDLSVPIRPRFRWAVSLPNLDQLGVARCRFAALPLALEGGDGSPVRAVAFVD